ncbi:MAG: hypothetical protein R3B95_02865 [Nitrospirales bacterium]|nr:hypothetical protein [Nitrospirales bacterium]
MAIPFQFMYLELLEEKDIRFSSSTHLKVQFGPLQGYSDRSVEFIKSEYENLPVLGALEAIYKGEIPEVSMETFLKGIVEHVI